MNPKNVMFLLFNALQLFSRSRVGLQAPEEGFEMFKQLEEEDTSLQVPLDTHLEICFFPTTICLGNQRMKYILQTLHLLSIYALRQVTEHLIMVISLVNQSFRDFVAVLV